jgi:tetrahydromethanopterin S-methyltransferase subunit G
MSKKKINKKQLSAPERHFGVILEDIDSKLDLVVERQQVLDKKIGRNHEEFQEFRSEVNYKFEIVFDELRLIRNELKEKVGRDEFTLLEKRVIALEKSRK